MPIIKILVDNIIDENVAYDIEEQLILKYGREGFEEDGILTNICTNNRPPIKKGDQNGMYGRKRTPEEKQKVSDANRGKIPWNKGIPREQSVKDAVSKANTGKMPWNKNIPRSDEDRQKMKDGWIVKKMQGFVQHNKGKTVPESEKVLCIYCNKLTSKSNHARWHGINCKKKDTQ